MVGSRPSRTARRWLAVTLGALTASACLAAAAWGLPPFTTAPKASIAGSGQAELYSMTVACHPTYDRLMLRFRFAKPGYRVEYVSQVTHDPSGLPVALLGSKSLLVVLRSTRAHTLGGTSLIPAVLTPRCPNLRQVKNAGDFEGIVSLGLGLRNKTGFRVFRLTSPRRVVVDISH